MFVLLLVNRAGLLSVLPQAPEETGTACKTWDGPSGSCSGSAASDVNLESVQRSYTAPDRTGIRIYYSPPAIRRTELQRRSPGPREPEQSQNGTSSDAPQPSSSFSSSYEQWLSSLSKQHRELLESRSGCVAAGSIPLAGIVVSNGGSANSLVDGMAPSPSPFHALEISANLSDDMKEMTNCVRQAIRSSSLERKSSKDSGSQVVLLYFFFFSWWLLPSANHLPPLNPAPSLQAPTNITTSRNLLFAPPPSNLCIRLLIYSSIVSPLYMSKPSYPGKTPITCPPPSSFFLFFNSFIHF